LVDGAADAFYLFDDKGCFLDVNRCACDSLGYSREELLKMSVTDIQMTPYKTEEGDSYWKHSLSRQPLTYEGIHRRKNGDTFPVEVRFSFLDHNGRSWCLALVRDISERKQADAALKAEQQLLRQLLDLMESDRKLVAFEIHDGLAQFLTAISLQLQAMQAKQEQHDSAAALNILPQVLELSKKSILEVRRLIGGLRPPVLDEAGILEAITYLVEEKKQTESTTIEFHHEVDFYHLAGPLESAIFRIVQEALTNACRYSDSKKIEIELKQADAMLYLRIQDWGKGFVPEEVKGPHFGLQGIRERARLLGGSAEIVSTPNEGTTIKVQLPLVERSAEEEDDSAE
jgi:PAS domain S-box-containing protein